MRVFAAGLGTETNTFSPLPTGMNEFRQHTYAPAGTHPTAMSMYGGPLYAARELASELGWQVFEGLVAGAQPGGNTTRAAYEALRDELIEDLRCALPVDIVLLGLHGAMVADGYDDCEGDLLARVRDLVGADAVVGVEFDPHAHLTRKMVNNATILVGYKEYPHTDIKARAFDLTRLCAATARGEIHPVAAMADTGMVVPIHTSRDPGRAFVDRVKSIEGKDGVLSISPVQGFATGDVPEMGCKVLVYTDGNAEQAASLAVQLAEELVSLRDQLMVQYHDIDHALDEALASASFPVVLADRADNPGSGAAGDSTFVLARLIERQIYDATLGPLWDPIAVQLALSAGEGARLRLRIGGKVSEMSGQPVDADCEVIALRRDMHTTSLAGDQHSVGDTALISVAGVDCVVISTRSQAIHIDMFTQLGCDLTRKKIVVVKSAQHFQASFSTITQRIIYVSAPGSATPDWRSLKYLKVPMPRWPIR
jgi:microcystin degradation protein MlrC